MHTRRIGSVDVSAIGLGAMPLSVTGRPDRARALRTVHGSLDAGVRLIDTADAYCLVADDFGHNEELVGQALRSWGGSAEDVLVATKGGHTRTQDGAWTLDGRPEHLRAACEASLRRLGVEAIGLYQLHRPDPAVALADSVGALAELMDAGLIVMAGVSNLDPEQIVAADDVLGGRLVSVQNQYSPSFTTSRAELDLCTERGIAFLPWSPLGGIATARDLGATHAAFAEVAGEVDASPQQVCLAWMLAASPVVIPIPGSSRPKSARASAAAADLALSASQLTRLDASVKA